MKKLCIALVLLGIFWGGSLPAQNEDRIKIKYFMSKVSFFDGAANLDLGREIDFRGWLYHADEDSLILLVKGLKKEGRLNPEPIAQIRIPAEKIKKIKIWKKARPYKGMVIGGIPLAAVGAITQSDNSLNGISLGGPYGPDNETLGMMGGFAFGIVGAGIGAGVASCTYRKVFRINFDPEAYHKARVKINDRFAIQPQLNP